MKNQFRRPRAKVGELKCQWGKMDGTEELIFSWNGVDKCDANLLINTMQAKRKNYKNEFDRSFEEELSSRGYDITTLKFSVQKKTEEL